MSPTTNTRERHADGVSVAGLIAAIDGPALDVLADRLAPRMRHRLQTAQRQDHWMDCKQASAYLGLSVNALHKLTAARTIPFEQDGPGCKLYFRHSDLDAWRQGKRFNGGQTA